MKNLFSPIHRFVLLIFAQLAYAQSTFAASDMGLNKISNEIKGSDNTADVEIQGLVSKGMTFLGILAVLYAIYGGFMILTASGDDAKVKKGKTVLFQALLGLLVIFLAYSIVSWLLISIFGGTSK